MFLAQKSLMMIILHKLKSDYLFNETIISCLYRDTLHAFTNLMNTVHIIVKWSIIIIHNGNVLLPAHSETAIMGYGKIQCCEHNAKTVVM